MKALTTRVFAGLGVVGTTGTAMAGVWYVNRPKDVKSKLVSERLILVGDSSRAWRAVFLTHKDDTEFVSFADLANIQDPKMAGPKILSACSGALRVAVNAVDYDSSLNKARKYCTTPQFKTVEAKILFSDKEISSEDRDWKDIFTLHKSDTSFIDKVKEVNRGFTLETSTVADTAKSLVQKFCNTLKDKPVDTENVSDYEKYCLQTPVNIQAFYEKQGHTLVGTNGWTSKFESIKTSDTSLVDDVKEGESLTQSSPATSVGPKLEKWFKEKVAQEINVADPNLEANVKVKSRCFN